MKKLLIFTTLALFVAPIAAAQDQCSADAKTALYTSFRNNRQTDQAKAYDDAKKYLACPAASEATEAEQKIIDYLKKWVTAYDEGLSKVKYRTLLYNDKKYPEAFSAGRELLAKEPDNLKVLVDLGTNGYLVANNKDLAPLALDYARRALQQLDAGKTLDDWQPLASKDVAVAYLNFTIATTTISTDPATALKHLMKAVEFETPLKKSPLTYAYIGGAYETGDYAKQSEEYKRLYGGKDETPESKLALANIHQVVDRMIDAYARAVALAGTDAAFAAQKPTWMESLTTWYKFRHNNTDTGMNELVAGILTKPLPPLPTPLTTPPQ